MTHQQSSRFGTNFNSYLPTFYNISSRKQFMHPDIFKFRKRANFFLQQKQIIFYLAVYADDSQGNDASSLFQQMIGRQEWTSKNYPQEVIFSNAAFSIVPSKYYLYTLIGRNIFQISTREQTKKIWFGHVRHLVCLDGCLARFRSADWQKILMKRRNHSLQIYRLERF